MLRNATALAVVMMLNGATALASERDRPTPPPSAATATASSEPATPATPAPLELWRVDRETKRPASLSALYVSFGTLQALDIASTRKAIAGGRREANPVMGSGGTARMVAVKSASTALTIYLVERTWKKSRTAAIVSMAIVNGLTAAVVAHNTRAVTR